MFHCLNTFNISREVSELPIDTDRLVIELVYATITKEKDECLAIFVSIVQ